MKIFNIKGRSRALSSSEEMNDTQRILKGVNTTKLISFITLILVVNVYLELIDMKDNQRTVLQWPSGQNAWVTGVDVDDTYARLMVGYVITMWGNVSSSTVSAQSGELLKFVHPYYHDTFREKLQKRAKQIKKYKTVSLSMRSVLGDGNEIKKSYLKDHSFSKIDTPVYKAEYLTRSNTLYGGKPKSQPYQRNLAIFFTVDNGKSWLLDIEEYEK